MAGRSSTSGVCNGVVSGWSLSVPSVRFSPLAAPEPPAGWDETCRPTSQGSWRFVAFLSLKQALEPAVRSRAAPSRRRLVAPLVVSLRPFEFLLHSSSSNSTAASCRMGAYSPVLAVFGGFQKALVARRIFPKKWRLGVQGGAREGKGRKMTGAARGCGIRERLLFIREKIFFLLYISYSSSFPAGVESFPKRPGKIGKDWEGFGLPLAHGLGKD